VTDWVRGLSQRKSKDCDSDADPGSDVDAGSNSEDHPNFQSEYAGEPRHTEDHEQSAVQKLCNLILLTPERSGYVALLATFETRTLNPDPLALDKVMAMSSGDSISVATHLLVGPWDSPRLRPSCICRICSNVGRPRPFVRGTGRCIKSVILNQTKIWRLPPNIALIWEQNVLTEKISFAEGMCFDDE
jgi:hypothetical protein